MVLCCVCFQICLSRVPFVKHAVPRVRNQESNGTAQKRREFNKVEKENKKNQQQLKGNGYLLFASFRGCLKIYFLSSERCVLEKQHCLPKGLDSMMR